MILGSSERPKKFIFWNTIQAIEHFSESTEAAPMADAPRTDATVTVNVDIPEFRVDPHGIE